MAGSSRRKQQRSRPQQITAHGQAQQDSLSFSATEGESRRRKVSIGLTLAFSKRHNSPPSSSALNDQGESRPFANLLPENCEKIPAGPLKEPGSSPGKFALNVQRQASSPRKWTSLDPFNYIDASPEDEIATAFNFSSSKMRGEECQEFASTKIVEVHRNRNYAAGSDKFVEEAFAAKSESAFIRYERRKDTTVVGEISMQKTQEVKSCKRRIGNHVRFNFDRGTSPSLENVGEKKDNRDADGCHSADSLRMKLRSALCLLNSSQNPQDLQEKNGKEPKSDTIETDSDVPNQTAKVLEDPSAFSSRRSNAKSKQRDSAVETRKSVKDSSRCTSPVENILQSLNAKSKEGNSAVKTRNSKKGSSPCTSPVENILRSSNVKSKQGVSAVMTRNSKKDSNPCTSPVENILRSSNAKSKQGDYVVITGNSKKDSSPCTSPVEIILRSSNAKSNQGDSAVMTRNSKKDSSPCTSPVENILRSSNAKPKQGDSAVMTRNSKKDSSPCTSPVENMLRSSKAESKQEDSALKARKSRKDSSPCASPVENIFSFDQDECLNDANICSRDYKGRSRRSEDNMFLDPGNVLHSSPERTEDRCSTFTVVEEMADHQFPSPPPLSPVIDVPPTEFDGVGKTCNINESPSTSTHSAMDHINGEEETTAGNAVVLPAKEELKLFFERESKRRSSRIAPRHNLVIEPQPQSRRQLRRKRKTNEFSLSPSSRERSHSVPEVRLSEDEDDDSSDLSRALKEFALVLQKFKRKLNMETDKRTSQILLSASHNIQKQVDNIEGQIQSDILKHTYLCKAKFREMDSNLQDQNEKLKLLHEKFRDELSQHLQSCQSTLSQIEGEQIEFRSIADRQKVSHRKLISQAQEFIQCELSDAEGKITAVRKVASNHLHLLKRVVGEIL